MSHPYSVTGVKSFRGREGYGFNAYLHRDGRKVAFVYDDASGGMFRYDWLAKDRDQQRADAEALTAYCTTLPQIDLGNGTLVACTEDDLLAQLVDAFEAAKTVRAGLKRKVMLVLDGQLREVKVTPSPEVLAVVAKQYPTATVLNSLPLETAMALALGALA